MKNLFKSVSFGNPAKFVYRGKGAPKSSMDGDEQFSVDSLYPKALQNAKSERTQFVTEMTKAEQLNNIENVVTDSLSFFSTSDRETSLLSTEEYMKFAIKYLDDLGGSDFFELYGAGKLSRIPKSEILKRVNEKLEDLKQFLKGHSQTVMWHDNLKQFLKSYYSVIWYDDFQKGLNKLIPAQKITEVRFSLLKNMRPEVLFGQVGFGDEIIPNYKLIKKYLPAGDRLNNIYTNKMKELDISIFYSRLFDDYIEGLKALVPEYERTKQAVIMARKLVFERNEDNYKLFYFCRNNIKELIPIKEFNRLNEIVEKRRIK